MGKKFSKRSTSTNVWPETTAAYKQNQLDVADELHLKKSSSIPGHHIKQRSTEGTALFLHSASPDNSVISPIPPKRLKHLRALLLSEETESSSRARLRLLRHHDGKCDIADLNCFPVIPHNTVEKYLRIDTNCDNKQNLTATTSLKICEQHVQHVFSQCRNDKCSGLHVCKFYLLSGECMMTMDGEHRTFGHNLDTPHNRKLLEEHLLHDLTLEELRTLFKLNRSKSCYPTPCEAYNSEYETCTRQLCTKLHCCQEYLKGNCAMGGCCLYSHDIYHSQPMNILYLYGFDIGLEKQKTFTDVQSGLLKCWFDNGIEHQSSRDYYQFVSDGEDHLFPVRSISRGRSPSRNSDLRGRSSSRNSEQRDRSTSRSSDWSGRSSISYNTHSNAENRNANTNINPGRANIGQDEIQHIQKLARVINTLGWSSITKTLVSACIYRAPVSLDFTEQRHNGDVPTICLDHLMGKVHCNPCCQDHHCNLPYQWQFYQPQMAQWIDFPDSQNKQTETSFCNPAITQHIFHWDNSPEVFMTTNFIEERIEVYSCIYLHTPIRRLTTPSAEEVPPDQPFETKWNWYWQNDHGKFIKYEDRTTTRCSNTNITSEEIEEIYTKNHEGHAHWSSIRYRYTIDFKNMVQRNDTGSVRTVRRRPVHFANAGIGERKINNVTFFNFAGRTVTNHSNRPSLSVEDFRSLWDMNAPTKTGKYQTVDLNSMSNFREYQMIQSVFQSTMPYNKYTIWKIQRIQNSRLLDNYQEFRKRMCRGSLEDVKEMLLFHGTKAHNIDAICAKGFDFRLSGRTTGTKYGRGTYFAKNANFAKHFTNSNQLFIARVLVGSYTTGKPDYVRPPLKNPFSPLEDDFDSCVDNINDPKRFVIFAIDQTYPAYLIDYGDANGQEWIQGGGSEDAQPALPTSPPVHLYQAHTPAYHTRPPAYWGQPHYPQISHMSFQRQY